MEQQARVGYMTEIAPRTETATINARAGDMIEIASRSSEPGHDRKSNNDRNSNKDRNGKGQI